MAAGDRNLVRNAIAQYFGGTLVPTDAGICYQNGPLAAAGLGTAYPYVVKGVPDGYFTIGVPAGFGWGAVMGIRQVHRATRREAMGGPTSGWRGRRYTIVCELVALSQERHVETAEQGLDDLVDAMHALIYADRTLGTTSGVYPTGRLITEAGEGPAGIEDLTEGFAPVAGDERGRYAGEGTLTFTALTQVAA